MRQYEVCLPFRNKAKAMHKKRGQTAFVDRHTSAGPKGILQIVPRRDKPAWRVFPQQVTFAQRRYLVQTSPKKHLGAK